jgi:adenosylcobinamide-phosphate synthase
MMFAAAMAVAMTIDIMLGWPPAIFARIGHPVTWVGRRIDRLDCLLNREADRPAQRRLLGIVTALVIIGVPTACATALQSVLPGGWLGALLIGILAWPLLAIRAMHEHVAAVEESLARGEVPAARQAVSMIVGRNASNLDEAGISRAALESLAENTSDGIVAPLFWGVAFGLPGIAAYKAINTLDSMIGHRTPRHEAFGWASARIDDVANLIPARLTGLAFALCSGHPGETLRAMFRDANKHRSPNAGWPEAALAAGLGVRLSGPRVYGDRIADEPWLNAAAREPNAADIGRGMALYRRVMALIGVLLVALAAL